MKRALAATFALVVVAACHGAPAGPAPVPVASASASAPAASSSAVVPAAPSPTAALALFHGHGNLHGAPFALPPDENGERWLVFAGTERAAVTAWLLTPGAKTKVTLAETLPAAAAVRSVVAKGDEAFILLESVAALDQPAGLWGVERIPLHELRARRLVDPRDRALALWGVKTEAALTERLDKTSPYREERDAFRRWGATEKDLKASLAGLGTEALLGAAMPPEGVDVYRRWQGSFVQPIEHRVAGKPGPRLLEIVRAVPSTGNCSTSERFDGGWCTAYTSDGVSHQVLFERAAGRWLVRALEENVPLPAPIASPTTPAAVARSATTTDTEAVHAMLSEIPATVVAEGRLTASGGSLGVAVLQGEPKSLVAIVHDGDFASEATLVGYDWIVGAPEVRLADLDGDGRTDVVVRRQQDYGSDGKVIVRYDAFLTPRTVEQTRTLDLAPALAMFHAVSIDAAVTQALALPTRGATRAEVCKLLNGAKDGAALAAASAPGASLWLYEDPLEPVLRPKKRALASATKDQMTTIHDDCPELVCDPSRPVCELRNEPGLDVFWLTWTAKGQLQLAGIALYTGS